MFDDVEKEEIYITTKQDQNNALRELCRLHPNDSILHIRFGKHLFAKGCEIAAIYAFRKAYQILKKNNPMEAGKLTAQYGAEVSLDEMQPMASEDYLPLQNYYGVFARRRHQLRLAEGDVLFNQGDTADSIYLLLEGELVVTTSLDDKPMLLNYLHPGALVGEAALQPDALRGATATANTPSRLLRFSANVLTKSFANFPDLHMQFSKEALLRRRMALLSSSQIFARLPMDLRFLVAQRTWQMSCEAGDMIKPAGESMPHVALITQGVVHLYEGGGDDKIYCGHLSAGAMIGMRQLMYDEVLALAFEAETRCEFLCMDFRVIEDVIEISPWFYRKINIMGQNISDHLTRTIMLQKESIAGTDSTHS